MAEVGENRSSTAPPRIRKKRLKGEKLDAHSSVQPRRSQKPQPNTTSMRGSVVGNTSRNPHEVEVVGSNPTPASKNTRSNSQALTCPECRSAKTWKDGIRETAFGPVQRYLCRSCGYRFSDPNSKQAQRQLNGSGMLEHVATILTKKLKSETAILNYCRVSDEPIKRASTGQLRLAKNLAEVEPDKKEAQREGTTETTDAKAKGLIIQYMSYLEREGYTGSSAYPDLLKILSKKADLQNSEDVKRAIAQRPWKNGTKMLAVYAYDAFIRMLKIKWDPPKYKQEETLPFVPDEKELDALISCCRSRRMATFLQTLKETFADPTEVLRLQWIDLNGNVITINKPVKGHLPGQFQISSKLVAMLNALPKANQRIFPSNYQTMYVCFVEVRKKVAMIQQNPRLNSISFRSFRHWGGNMIAHYTNGNVLEVKKQLRHKRIENTMKYINMINFKDDEFDVATATSDEDIKKLGAAGFQKYDERKIGEMCISFYRSPKRFGQKPQV